MSLSSNLLPITHMFVSSAKPMARMRDKAGNVYYSCLFKLAFQQDIGDFFQTIQLGMPNSLR